MSLTMKDGQIVRIRLENFLTYVECEFQPGEHLNVILGPNGTGKSSIVCAICLGLGGAPSLLGRAKELGDYVKHRATKAVIEIELYSSLDGNNVIKRVIHKERNRSEWLLNGVGSTLKQVQETVAKLNIQMSNLCQFLPQDRVIEFAKMSPQQLLEATEKAVGPEGMHEDHMQLIALHCKRAELEKKRCEVGDSIARLQHRNDLLEREVARFKEREMHAERILILEKKLPWLKYETARVLHAELLSEAEELRARLRETQGRQAPLADVLAKSQASLQDMDTAYQRLVEDAQRKIASVKEISDQLVKEGEKVEDVRSEIKAAEEAEVLRQNRIKGFERDIASLQKELANAPDPEGLQPRHHEVAQTIRQLQMKLTDLSRERSQLNADLEQVKSSLSVTKSNLKRVENIDNRRLENLRARDRQTYDAVLWLRDNKGIFSRKIYEPIMTQINMKNIDDAPIVESVISYNDMVAFVCETREDQALFMNEMRDKQGLRVAAVCPPNDPLDKYKPQKPLHELKKYDFKCFVRDLFDAPDVVMKYLCANYHVEGIPVGTSVTESLTDKLMNEGNGPTRFFTPVNQYFITKSRYENKTTTQVQAVKKKGNVLNAALDMTEKKTLEVELATCNQAHSDLVARGEHLRGEEDSVTKELEKLRLEQKSIRSMLQVRQTLRNQIEARSQRLQDEVKNTPVEDNRKQTDKILQINKRRVQLAKQYFAATRECVAVNKRRLRAALLVLQAHAAATLAETRLRDASVTLKQVEEECMRATLKSREQKVAARKILEVAKKACGLRGDEELSDDIKDLFSNLPSTESDLEAMIHEEQARLNCSFPVNNEVIDDYEKRKRTIAAMTEESMELGDELGQVTEENTRILARWEEPLGRLLAKINEQFSSFFRRIGCAGQVSLQKGQDNENDYRTWGAHIQVQFRRTGQMKSLTSFYQSGGERSVSTMLYLLSLQGLTKCPFRLVDEINQGMDPTNERRVFDLVVETMCQPNSSQYFLVTPKLLPDLKYCDRMTVLTIFNGHWMLPPSQFDVKRFIRNKEKLSRKKNHPN